MNVFTGLARKTSAPVLKRLHQGMCVAIVFAAAPAAHAGAMDQSSDATATAHGIAWGEPKNGFRLGLSPKIVNVPLDDEHLTVNIWIENCGNTPRQVPLGSWGKMLLAAVRWKNSPPYDNLFYLADHSKLKKVLRERELQPGQRLRLECVVQLSNYAGSLKLNQFGVSPAGDSLPKGPFRLYAGLLSACETPSTTEHWRDPRLIRSGKIHVAWGNEQEND